MHTDGKELPRYLRNPQGSRSSPLRGERKQERGANSQPSPINSHPFCAFCAFSQPTSKPPATKERKDRKAATSRRAAFIPLPRGASDCGASVESTLKPRISLMRTDGKKTSAQFVRDQLLAPPRGEETGAVFQPSTLNPATFTFSPTASFIAHADPTRPGCAKGPSA